MHHNSNSVVVGHTTQVASAGGVVSGDAIEATIDNLGIRSVSCACKRTELGRGKRVLFSFLSQRPSVLYTAVDVSSTPGGCRHRWIIVQLHTSRSATSPQHMHKNIYSYPRSNPIYSAVYRRLGFGQWIVRTHSTWVGRRRAGTGVTFMLPPHLSPTLRVQVLR